jgi:metallo-beta-lactamase family protein
MNNPLKVTFWTGVGSVTGANFMMESGESRILIDCGLTQGGRDEFDTNAKPFEYDPASADFLFVTHAHMDHIGRIPKLVRDGFKGVIYSHLATKDLSEVMLPDALRIMEMDAREKGKEPYYSAADVENALSRWQTLPYYEPKEIAGYTVTLKDAGHVLGSTMYFFAKDGKTVVFTGDLGNSPSPLLRDTDSIDGATYVIMESVYGDRNHEEREERIDKLKEIIEDTISRGGALVIPAFSLERTQMILYELNHLIENKLIKSVPVFVDSPLATKVTEIYSRYKDLFNDTVRKDVAAGDDIFSFPRLSFTLRREESAGIERTPNPKIIIAGSGMSMGGRVQSHEAEHLGDPKSALLLVGYQTMGSLGRHLQDGAKEVTIAGKKISVRAKVEMISSFSSHKDSDHLVEFIDEGRSKLKKVFVVMGEPKSSLFLAQRLRDYAEVDAQFPEQGKPYELR